MQGSVPSRQSESSQHCLQIPSVQTWASRHLSTTQEWVVVLHPSPIVTSQSLSFRHPQHAWQSSDGKGLSDGHPDIPVSSSGLHRCTPLSVATQVYFVASGHGCASEHGGTHVPEEDPSAFQQRLPASQSKSYVHNRQPVVTLHSPDVMSHT